MGSKPSIQSVITSTDKPTPAPPVSPQPTQQSTAAAQSTSINPTADKAPDVELNPQNPATLDGYIILKENPSGLPGFKFHGLCKKCGWQSYQPTKQLAMDMVKIHAQKHLMGR